MKKISIYLKLFVLFFVFTSCESTPVAVVSEERKTDSEEIVISEDEIAANNFINSIENITIKITKSPKSVNVKKDFSSPFEIEVTDADGNVKSNFPISLSYPISKENNEFSYEILNVMTDENGKYVFKAPKPTFAANTKITFYPTPVNDFAIQAAIEKSVTADWKVKSDIISKGAVLFVWDFNEKDRPVNNSYNILSEFKKQQIYLVGNAPVNESTDIGKPIANLYKKNYEIIANSYGYLIVGTIKFTKPVEKCDDGFLCSLISEIQAVDMITGNVVFSSTFTNESTGANWNACVTTCKDEISAKIVDALIYGL